MKPLDLSSIDSTWTLLLDRDGVLNEHIVGDYVRHPKQLKVLPGVQEAIEVLSDRFERLIIVTNQQGVGKKLMSHNDLMRVHQALEERIERKMDGIYACTQLKKQANNCRKPSPQMFKHIRRDFPQVDPKKTIMVGDSKSDMEFAENCQLYFIRILSEHHQDFSTYEHNTFASLKDFSDALNCKA